MLIHKKTGMGIEIDEPLWRVSFHKLPLKGEKRWADGCGTIVSPLHWLMDFRRIPMKARVHPVYRNI